MTFRRDTGMPRRVVVTGGADGIGRAIVEAFLADGSVVAAVDIDDGRLSRLAESRPSDSAGRLVSIRADVSSEVDAAHAIEAFVVEAGGIDTLVNNAGIVRYGTVPDGRLEDWSAVLATNLLGAYYMSRFAIREMRRSGGGAIVNVASVQAFATQEGVAAYSTSKAGLLGLSRAMALDHASEGIRVNCVAPGSVRTPMLLSGARDADPANPEAVLDRWGSQHPIGRLIEPAEIAAVVHFLAGDGASAITGVAIPVDGGLLARLSVQREP